MWAFGMLGGDGHVADGRAEARPYDGVQIGCAADGHAETDAQKRVPTGERCLPLNVMVRRVNCRGWWRV
jgi:hypothetical protein